MSQPGARLLPWLVSLLLSATASAHPAPLARERVERRITLSASPREPLPEVRVARGVLTNLILDAPVEKASVELAGRASHFKRVEVAEHALLLEPSVELGPRERLKLRMRLEDGTEVALVLVSHPAQVDGRVDVERPLLDEAPRAELAEARARLAVLEAHCAEDALVGLLLADLLGEGGVSARPIAKEAGGTEPKLLEGWGYRATKWALVDVKRLGLAREAGPWELGEARLVSPEGLTVEAVPVRPTRPRLAPGEEGRIILRTPEPHWDVGTVFRLEVSNGSGPPLVLGRVQL